MSKSTKISKENEYKYIQIGLNISYYRKLRGYTQEDLADLISVSRTYLSYIEAPNMVQNISLEILFDIAKILDIEPHKLLIFRE